MPTTIEFRCNIRTAPECRGTVATPRHKGDPPEAMFAILACDECESEGGLTYYYDADGEELDANPDRWRKPKANRRRRGGEPTKEKP